MKIPSTRLIAGLVPAFLAACAMTPERCNPNRVDNVFQSALCQDMFQQRIANLEQKIQSVRDEHRATEAETDRYLKDARSLAANRARLQMDLDRMQLQLSGQAARVAGLKQHTEEQKRLVTAMNRELSDARAELAKLGTNERVSAQRIARLKAEIKSKQDTYTALTKLYEAVE
ncbi:MAG: hypothetical protein KDJ31_09330 [Candidatus Competibacteraceae bacterium]|nr:hypothetical protein [Candidatus Competibacteraceae bacterium]